MFRSILLLIGCVLLMTCQSQFMDDPECEDYQGSESCEYLNSHFNLCAPQSLLYSDMVYYCQLTCGECRFDDEEGEEENNEEENKEEEEENKEEESEEEENEEEEEEGNEEESNEEEKENNESDENEEEDSNKFDDDSGCEDTLTSESSPNATLNCQTFQYLCADSSNIGQRVFAECPVTCGSCRQDDDPVCEDTLANSKSPDPTLNCQTFQGYCTLDGNIADRVRSECALTCGFCTAA